MMMKKTFFAPTLLLLALSSCKKPDVPHLSEDDTISSVTFKLKRFSSSIEPLANVSSVMAKTQRSSSSNSYPSTLVATDTEIGHLYFWSFNNSDLVPDIAIHRNSAAIRFEAEDNKASYFPGYGNDDFAAGMSFSSRGTQELLFSMSLKEVSQLNTLDFDAGSSGTGPKNFRLYYSIDGGTDFHLLSEDNPFTNMNAQARNQFTFDLSPLTNALDQENFILKIEPYAGERGSAGEYNEKTGTLRIDNFRLTGIFDGAYIDQPETMIDQLHYYIFNADNHQLVADSMISRQANNDEQELAVRLPAGEYYAFFVSNASAEVLMLPSSTRQAADLYVGNHFDNTDAQIFGAITPTFELSNSTELEVILHRYFSDILFEFTDEEGLDMADEVRIRPIHDPIFYTPFGIPGAMPNIETSSIVFKQPFADGDHSLRFNQFLGERESLYELAYEVSVYATDGNHIRTFTVEAAAPSNVQLTFNGELLSGTDRIGGFNIGWNTKWGDSISDTF